METASAFSLGMAKMASRVLKSHWYTPTYPGEEGIISPRLRSGAHKRHRNEGQFNTEHKHGKIERRAHMKTR